jgi:hypothetical protein
VPNTILDVLSVLAKMGNRYLPGTQVWENPLVNRNRERIPVIKWGESFIGDPKI